MSPFIDHDESMAEHYREFPEDAVALLNAVLEPGEPGEPGELLIVLRQLAKAFGGVPAIAEKADLNPTQLYRTLSPEGNPSLTTLTAILKAMDLQLVVKSAGCLSPWKRHLRRSGDPRHPCGLTRSHRSSLKPHAE